MMHTVHTRPVPRPAVPTDAGPASPAAVVQRFLDLLRDGDFDALEALFTGDVWLRALLVKTIHQSNNAAEAAAALRGWVGSPHGRHLLEAAHHPMAGRRFLRYRFLVRPHFAPEHWHVVEQSGYCRVADGRIRRMDLACTGYFPAEEALVEAAGLVDEGGGDG